jgi:geranylgeranyl diphosphate synthase type II
MTPRARNAIGTILRDERNAVDMAMARILDERVESLDPRLAEPIRYALEGGGKRLRPILCITAFRALRKAPVAAPVYEAACAIEMIHTYSLAHDTVSPDWDLRLVTGRWRFRRRGAALPRPPGVPRS